MGKRAKARGEVEPDAVAFKGSPGHGVVYTRPSVVQLCFDLAEYVSNRDLTGIRVLDVGCGYGQFIAEAARRLAASATRQSLDEGKLRSLFASALHGVEVDPRTADAAAAAVAQASKASGIEVSPANLGVAKADFLTWEEPAQGYDLVIGNLPYVKYDAIAKLAHGHDLDWMRREFETFRGRADYSVAFLEKAVRLLAPGGRAVLISSNRFTQAEYGHELRKFLAGRFKRIDEVDLSLVNAFDERVSAYASIFIIRKGSRRPGRYVRLRSLSPRGLSRLRRLGAHAATNTKHYSVHSRIIAADGAPWSPLPLHLTALLARLAKKFPSLKERGFGIRKGPATGADDVFVRPISEFSFTDATVRKQLLPLYHSGSARPSRSLTAGRFLLSVYESGTRELIDLNDFPLDVSEYLVSHKARLSERHIVQHGADEWWRTIDAYDPGLTSKTKVLIPDLQSGRAVRVDEGRYFPAHTVLYALGSRQTLNGVAAALRTPLADLYRIWRSPALSNSTPRASSKVLNAFPIPDLKDLCFSRGDDRRTIVYQAYGLTTKEIKTVDRAYDSVMSAAA